MRSSKSRSRGNKNRNNRPSGGSIVNRVFDSSGPDGKVRGTPQQIIEKYNQLHRDAQLSNDRVNAENFAQHAEHYTRMLAEAQREIDRQREEQEAQNRERQAERDRQSERDRERQQRLKSQEEASGTTPDADPAKPQDGERRQPRRKPRDDNRPAAAAPTADATPADPGSSEQPDVDLGINNVGFLQTDDASGLVETPEEKQTKAPAKRTPRPRKPRAPKAPPSEPPTEAAE